MATDLYLISALVSSPVIVNVSAKSKSTPTSPSPLSSSSTFQHLLHHRHRCKIVCSRTRIDRKNDNNKIDYQRRASISNKKPLSIFNSFPSSYVTSSSPLFILITLYSLSLATSLIPKPVTSSSSPPLQQQPPPSGHHYLTTDGFHSPSSVRQSYQKQHHQRHLGASLPLANNTNYHSDYQDRFNRRQDQSTQQRNSLSSIASNSQNQQSHNQNYNLNHQHQHDNRNNNKHQHHHHSRQEPHLVNTGTSLKDGKNNQMAVASLVPALTSALSRPFEASEAHMLQVGSASARSHDEARSILRLALDMMNGDLQPSSSSSSSSSSSPSSPLVSASSSKLLNGYDATMARGIIDLLTNSEAPYTHSQQNQQLFINSMNSPVNLHQLDQLTNQLNHKSISATTDMSTSSSSVAPSSSFVSAALSLADTSLASSSPNYQLASGSHQINRAASNTNQNQQQPHSLPTINIIDYDFMQNDFSNSQSQSPLNHQTSKLQPHSSHHHIAIKNFTSLRPAYHQVAIGINGQQHLQQPATSSFSTLLQQHMTTTTTTTARPNLIMSPHYNNNNNNNQALTSFAANQEGSHGLESDEQETINYDPVGFSSLPHPSSSHSGDMPTVISDTIHTSDQRPYSSSDHTIQSNIDGALINDQQAFRGGSVWQQNSKENFRKRFKKKLSNVIAYSTDISSTGSSVGPNPTQHLQLDTISSSATAPSSSSVPSRLHLNNNNNMTPSHEMGPEMEEVEDEGDGIGVDLMVPPTIASIHPNRTLQQQQQHLLNNNNHHQAKQQPEMLIISSVDSQTNKSSTSSANAKQANDRRRSTLANGLVQQLLPQMQIKSRFNQGCVGGTKCQFFAFCWMSGGSLGASCGLLMTCCVTPSRTEIQPVFYGPVVNDPYCGRSTSKISRIVGGSDASFGQFPWQAFVQVGGSRCGGALVSSRHVVTAGHCVARSQHSPSSIKVTLGDYILNSDIESLPHEVFSVVDVLLHPNFRFTPQADRYDVAVLVLDRSAQYKDNIKPICLPQKDAAFIGRVAYVAGWGALQAGSKLRPKVLQHVAVPVIENNVCENWHRRKGIDIRIYDEMMCAGYELGQRDACQGDSGGPLMLNQFGVWYLVGIVSAGYSCAKQYQPGIYHRVSSSSDWISSNVYQQSTK